ncbi:threonylcarbamoyl-AMP synthase, partial [Clostridia bacterium OttesenSCG-928-O13]|nr:threonylcarbamoyl-AMP synthase [Clostridia bacterium OttesenSCG-928-O13]
MVEQPGKEAMALAARLLREGQVVGMPTETVYGLAANALDDEAVQRIFLAKGRPQDNPLIVHIAVEEDLPRVARSVPENARALARRFWPGPLTMILPKGPRLAPSVSAGLDTVGVRLPAHPVARELIRLAGVPLAAPSANTSGSPSPTTARHVESDLAGKIPLILDGGSCPVGVESTVLSLVGSPVILRPGFVTREELEEALGCSVAYSPSLNAALDEGETPASPGMKYRHYAPQTQLTIVGGGLSDFIT